MWNQQDAIDLCRIVENVAPRFGCHVALTGGFLYKDGERKDADLMFYRIRQAPEIDRPGLLHALAVMGFDILDDKGWVQKATFLGKDVDLFFPDYDGDGEYGAQDDGIEIIEPTEEALRAEFNS